jgi:hypothetical protein
LVLNPLGGSFDVLGVPYVSKWIRDGIDAGLGTLLCENGGIKIDFDRDGDPIVALGFERKPFEPAAGILFLWIYEARNLKNLDRFRLLGGMSDPYVRVARGEKVIDNTSWVLNSLNPVFNHLTPVLVPSCVINGGSSTEDEGVSGSITLSVLDKMDVTKPLGMGYVSLDMAELCHSYMDEEDKKAAVERPIEQTLALKSMKGSSESNRGTLRIGYRYTSLGDPIPKGSSILDTGFSSGVLRVAIMSVDFPGAKFWQGHLRASLYDRECWRGVSRQVWTKDLIVEEFEVYVSELSSAIFALRVHRGISREVLKEKTAAKQQGKSTGQEEDGSVAGEVIANLATLLANPPEKNWFALSGVSPKDLKSETETRVGLTMKFALRPVGAATVDKDIRHLSEVTMGKSISAMAQQSLA